MNWLCQFCASRSQRLGLKHCGSWFYSDKKKFKRVNHTASTSQHSPRRCWEAVFYIIVEEILLIGACIGLFMIRLFVPCIYIYIYISVQHLYNLFHHTIFGLTFVSTILEIVHTRAVFDPQGSTVFIHSFYNCCACWQSTYQSSYNMWYSYLIYLYIKNKISAYLIIHVVVISCNL